MHFSGEQAVFEAGRGKIPNFNEMKQEGGKRSFGGFKLDYCRNRAVDGTDKGIFAEFQCQNKQKDEGAVSKWFEGSILRQPLYL